MGERYSTKRLGVFSPEVFLPVFVAAFYIAGLLLVEASIKSLIVILVGIIVFLAFSRLAVRYIEMPDKQDLLREDYFERLLLSLLVIFLIDLALKNLMPVHIRAPLYLLLMILMFSYLGRTGLSLPASGYLGLGLIMILVYIVPSFIFYGFYGTYLNRTAGLMPAFLVGIGTITTVYGILKLSSDLSTKRLFILTGLIVFVAGPLMAALVGYRAYAIFYIMPLIFQYYLERRPPSDIKADLKAVAIVIVIFMYTYFATSVTRGVIYMLAPLDSPKAPAFVAESMKKGRYTDKDITYSSPEARSKIITRPFFTYKVFLDVVERSYPWGESHGKLTLSLMPGINLGRATTISLLKKPLSTSFFGLPFLEFGFAGVFFYAAILGLCLAVVSSFKDLKVYALMLTIIMLWLDTGPSVWWHWLPFASAIMTITTVVYGWVRSYKSRK